MAALSPAAPTLPIELTMYTRARCSFRKRNWAAPVGVQDAAIDVILATIIQPLRPSAPRVVPATRRRGACAAVSTECPQSVHERGGTRRHLVAPGGGAWTENRRSGGMR
jgi:hypothetical protein